MSHRSIAALSAAAILFVACSSAIPEQAGTISVAASFYPLAFLAQHIGGNDVVVHQITPGGVEPHDYDPSPQQLATVHTSNVFLMNGGGFDTWGDKIFEDVKNAGLTSIRMADSIALMEGSSEEHEEEEEGHEEEQQKGVDPHIWLSPVIMTKEAEIIRDAFIQADPAHAEGYRTRTDALLQKLQELDGEFRSGLATCAKQDVVVSHNAFQYLAKEYDFNTLAISGLSPEEEPSPKRLAELADFAQGHDIQHIFFETLVSPKLSETIANEIGAVSLVLNPVEGLTDDESAKGEDYISVMKQNLHNLRIAMQCQP